MVSKPYSSFTKKDKILSQKLFKIGFDSFENKNQLTDSNDFNNSNDKTKSKQTSLMENTDFYPSFDINLSEKTKMNRLHKNESSNIQTSDFYDKQFFNKAESLKTKNKDALFKIITNKQYSKYFEQKRNQMRPFLHDFVRREMSSRILDSTNGDVIQNFGIKSLNTEFNFKTFSTTEGAFNKRNTNDSDYSRHSHNSQMASENRMLVFDDEFYNSLDFDECIASLVGPEVEKWNISEELEFWNRQPAPFMKIKNQEIKDSFKITENKNIKKEPSKNQKNQTKINNPRIKNRSKNTKNKN